MKKIKEFFQRPVFKNILAPVLRGGVKGFFPPALIIESVSNWLTPVDKPRKHSALSLAVQLVVLLLAVLDIWLNGGANLKAIFEFIKSIWLTAGSEVAPVVGVDTIQ
jgi:hypothetical protein